ncbi:general transcription factor 3C polypeptide 1 [Venturia canescens]|uniref:general transcription factor 3C polypeptide 1 n=1 Tax=Venturia canescens TaxID=32260 RepID=UPI001C9D55DD|nr:general transcription factor 3C polypeptide 1 [Venturia canescens]XP_043286774.1 general transcription factor 3C polypeptide 1 [Venturia canescens]
MNLVDCVIDEIALEGLDGITLEALWDRLALRFHEKVAPSKGFKEQVWYICLHVRQLSFFLLEKERDKLIIFDRYEFVDPDLGIILESEDAPDDIYEHCPIDDVKNGIKGSCSTYYTRKNASNEVQDLTVHEAEAKYGRKLVIVASQTARQHALMDKSVSPILELTVIQYCFLERVGRSRYHGEVTHGKLSLGLLKEDPSSLFYHRKFLLRHKLVTKQPHHQKSNGQGYSGSLLHLPRFYVERKPKVIFLAEKVIEILKSRPNQVAEYAEIKKELGINNSIKKLFKTSFFQKVVKTDLLVPWRTLYPDAADAEWQCKNNSAKEKSLRVVQLIDPNMDINDLWKDEFFVIEDEDPYELDISQQEYAVSFLRQANVIIEASGSEGLSQTELAIKMGLPNLQARSIIRNLSKMNIIAMYMQDMGRQRVTKYVSRKFANGAHVEQFKREMSKMKNLTKIGIEKESATDGKEKTLKLSSDTQKTETKTVTAAPILEKKDDSSSLDAARKILGKYKLTGLKRSYKKTFCNVAESKQLPVVAVKRRKLTKDKKDISDNLKIEEVKEKLFGDQPAAQRSRSNDIISLYDLSGADMTNTVSNVTYRLLKRANIIVEAVKKHKVVDDMTKLMKFITEEEEREGYDVKIDKRSLIRLLQKLARDNLVKNIKLTLSTNNKKKNLTFICDSSIDVNHTVIKSAVEQAKIKLCLTGGRRVRTVLQSNDEKLEISGDSATEKVETIEGLTGNEEGSKKTLPPDLVYDRKAGARYGYAPKFIRMQTLHTYIYYLIYQHPGKPTESREQLIEVLRTKGVSIDDKLEKDMGEIYNTEIGWKMFVPPLPKHSGWPTGWALMCDILLRMPLSIFFKLHKVLYVVPELEEYINNPIRKHVLVKDIPAPIRNVLLLRRKYIFSIHDSILRLCYIGLLQFGPQKFKEKDKLFIYLNRKTQIMDTTSSAAHYHKIEAKVYPVVRYTFTSLQTVDKYWYKLWMTCVNTRLGGRLVVQGEDIILEDLTKKNEMIEATKPRSPEEAYTMDNGDVPGDRMGAAGIDSAFFAHLKRNWSSESSSYPTDRSDSGLNESREKITNPETKRGSGGGDNKSNDSKSSKVKTKTFKFTDYHGLQKITGPITIDAIDLRKTITKKSTGGARDLTKGGASQKSKTNNASGAPLSGLKNGRAANRERSYVRRVLARPKHVRGRVKYDEIDNSALQRMEKLRVDWDNREDNILLVCKVAMMYLCPKPRKQMIGFTSVRDVLRSYSSTSYNKTSRACQRRLLYMLKKPETHHSVTLGVEELKQDFYVGRRFGEKIDQLKRDHRGTHKYYEQVNLVFRDLVAHIANKYYDISDIGRSSLNLTPRTVEGFHLFNRVKYPRKGGGPGTNVTSFNDETSNDIHSSTINSVIHSSMCCVKDRRSWAYQLFRIYQQYPEWLLRSAMAKIRLDQMVTVKKNYAFAIRKQSNACMPMSSSQYQLSSGYLQKFNTKFPYTAFDEAYQFFDQLANHYSERELQPGAADGTNEMITCPVNGGTVAAIHDFINIDQLEFDIEIPRHIIMLDPTLQKDDERYIRIARRYQDLLRNLEHVDIDGILESSESSQAQQQKQPTPLVDDQLPSKPAASSPRLTPPLPPRIVTEAHDGEKSVQSQDKKSSSMCSKYSTSQRSQANKDDKNNSNGSEHDLEAKKTVPQLPKSQDFHDTSINPADQERETEDEFFSNEENCCNDDDIEEEQDEDEDDNLICFIDGTKIRLTAEDIENSGFQVEMSSPLKNKPARIPQDSAIPAVSNPGDNNDLDMEVEPLNEEPNKASEELNEKDLSTVVDESDCQMDETELPQQIDPSDRDVPSDHVRVNQLIERSNCEKFQLSSSHHRTCESSNDMQKRYTRLAMLQMREELSDLASSDSHHAHEYFVLNMFKIYHSLRRSNVDKEATAAASSDGSSSGPELPPKELLALNRQNYSAIIADLKKFAIFPKAATSGASYYKFRQDLPESDLFKRGLDAVYEFIRDRREVGASLSQLLTKFYSILGDQLFDILSVLKQGRIVLRSGVTNTRYVHQNYADPWLIHSYKIMRLQKEAHQNLSPGSLYVVPEEKNKETNEGRQTSKNNQINDSLESNEAMEVATIEEKQEIEECTRNDQAAPDDSETAKPNQSKMQKSRTCLLPTKDIYRAAKQLDLDTAEEIRVVVRPWIRIDGALNRRVLDRMLGGILAYCLMHPGVHLTKVEEKFSPAIQPFHTKELVEILMRLKCLKTGCTRKSRITLFSKSSSLRAEFSSMPKRCEWLEEEIVIEPTLDATVNFSMFLSNRTYASNFLA